VKLSVSVITYNHERYIAQALDSILMQDVDFEFEIIVGEDCSGDRTREIVRAYQEKHPGLIRTILPEKNLGNGGKRILAQTLEMCRGEYIARMDGDDYWTSALKLRKQVEFLDEHADCSMCYHDVLVVYEDQSQEAHTAVSAQQPIFSQADALFAGTFVPSCSPLIRKSALLPLPSWYQNLPSGDWSMYLTAAEHGMIGYLNEVMGVYRVHRGGLWSGLDPIAQLRHLVELFVRLEAATGERYRRQINWALSERYLRLARQHAHRGEHFEARRYAQKALRRNPLGRGIDRRRLLRYLAKPYTSLLSRFVARLRQWPNSRT
jgi:glycosyltransferase involved in cell wall biosynthesis